MATTKGSIVGREVYDKRAGMMGKVLKEDGLSLVIEFSTADGVTTKTITPATFISLSLSLCLPDSLSTLLPLFLSDFGPRVLDSLLLFVVVVAVLLTGTGPAQQCCLRSLVAPARNG